jgi:hypothetical protein
MKADKFYNSIKDIECIDDCSNPRTKIFNIIDQSVRGDYKRIIKIIKKLLPDFYNSLALDFYNPWCNKTYRSRDGKYIIITHSSIEYLIRIN